MAVMLLVLVEAKKNCSTHMTTTKANLEPRTWFLFTQAVRKSSSLQTADKHHFEIILVTEGRYLQVIVLCRDELLTRSTPKNPRQASPASFLKGL